MNDRAGFIEVPISDTELARLASIEAFGQKLYAARRLNDGRLYIVTDLREGLL